MRGSEQYCIKVDTRGAGRGKKRHWQWYNTWVEDIARVRRVWLRQFDSIGRGRVWTGEQALELGLVDSLGTLDGGVSQSRHRWPGPDRRRVSESHYPKQLTFWDAIQQGEWMIAREALARSIWNDARPSPCAPVTKPSPPGSGFPSWPSTRVLCLDASPQGGEVVTATDRYEADLLATAKSWP